MARYANIRVEEEARQDVISLYKKYPNSEVRFNYVDSTARLYTDGVDENILLFGDTFRTLSELARGAQKCAVGKMWERMKNN